MSGISYPDDYKSKTGYNFEANNYKYTPVKVKDKDSGNIFTIQMVNAEIKGNKAKWTVKDGKIYDAQGKELKNNTIEVTRYQAQIIKAAAEAGEISSKKRLNDYDFNGSKFTETVRKSLAEGKSEYKVTEAHAHGMFYADVENKKGEKGHLEITFIKDPPPPKQETEFKWYNPLTWF